MDDGFTYRLSDLHGGLNEAFYDSLRMWPQTRICYVVMNDGTIMVAAIADKLLAPGAFVNEHQIEWSIPVKWEYKNRKL